MIGKTVIVYDRYLFAVPVKGRVRSISEKDGAYQVDFFSNNPGGQNVIKHNGGYFHHQQCEIVDENKLIERTELLENTLKVVLKRWKYDADQGDGIHETDYRLYNRAMKLIDKDYEPG